MRGHIILAAAVALAGAGQAGADDLVRVKTGKSVDAAMDALQAAVEGAGATVFARVDHAAGARGAGLEMNDAELLIFGNPKLGTPVMQADPLAGLFLPLKVLAYADGDGQVWLAYQDPAEMLDDLAVDDDLPAIGKMQGALDKLTAKAAGG
ncbi:DUF302 domain-containing protein [Sedimentitalea nanhaiensis]|uniref:Uncharacterized conserved protein, DUF302 family n=1 Tax=Sedimentitalea nanhaiensis TaxID=999627 RepID=A0A1I7B1F9_9RHOB|nr:DUF302 domain-containing protein [Sedimentitalea nanhaiensis]SFT81009.1 Uncharacterized conserved protein, DUF302 family [Sedimentitalea nanhaiensis]